MKFLLTNKHVSPEVLKRSPFELGRKNIGAFNLFTSEDFKKVETDRFYGVLDGYIRDLQKKIFDLKGQEKSTFEAIADTWPLPDNITGSFSGTLINKHTNQVILCNDLIGPYPLYYLKFSGGLYISNSLLVLGITTGVDFDDAGVVQRCIGPEYLNFGSRTILKGCKRLLPGEKIIFNEKGRIIKKEYDNTLYQNLENAEKSSGKNNQYLSFWNFFKKEIAYCLNKTDEVNIALSGGIDSRILLAAIPENKKISCFTFGDIQNYETRIARKLAQRKKAYFKNFFHPEMYFPSLEVMTKYTLKAEAVFLCSWLEILENSKSSGNQAFLIGDLTTALTGRTIAKFSTKEFQKKNFFKYHILKSNYPLQKSTKESFDDWKAKKLSSIEMWYTEKRLEEFDIKTSRKNLLISLKADLEEIFKRIKDHCLPYQELYDEIFTWYTHTRIPMGKQILISNDDYSTSCPSMSMGVLRKTSSIHPNHRLGYRYLKKLITISPELKKLFALPTSQAPLVPHNAPDFLKYPIWGLRSLADQFLIKRLMKTKNISRRYRLFASINWAMVYQNPKMEINLKNYFSPNHIGENHYEVLHQKAVRRKRLQEWPFANLEIINSSSLNVEMELIKSYRRKG